MLFLCLPEGIDIWDLFDPAEAELAAAPEKDTQQEHETMQPGSKKPQRNGRSPVK